MNKPKNYFKDFASQHPSKLRFENNEKQKNAQASSALE